jgi:hypothetical protein
MKLKFKLNAWDILSILVILGTVIMVIVMFSIFSDPTSSINPFPPATLPPTIYIPTSTLTPVRLPPTWTPTPWISPTMRPSSTPIPTNTPVVID